MNRSNLALAILVAGLAASTACAPRLASRSEISSTGPPASADQIAPGLRSQDVVTEVEAAVVEHFGMEVLKKARSSDGYVMVRRYDGLPRAEIGGGGTQPPVAAVLVLDQKTWSRAVGKGALRKLTPLEQSRWAAALADLEPWQEPAFAMPSCTDAGATYIIASVPGRPFLLRAANCATPRSEKLGLAAIEL